MRLRSFFPVEFFFSFLLTDYRVCSCKVVVKNPNLKLEGRPSLSEPPKKDGQPRPWIFFHYLFRVKWNARSDQRVKDCIALFSIIARPDTIRSNRRGFDCGGDKWDVAIAATNKTVAEFRFAERADTRELSWVERFR
jgi:hypothetical protein